jgi:hypothetical protein
MVLQEMPKKLWNPVQNKRQPKKSSLSHERSMVNEKIPECESDTKRK